MKKTKSHIKKKITKMRKKNVTRKRKVMRKTGIKRKSRILKRSKKRRSGGNPPTTTKKEREAAETRRNMDFIAMQQRKIAMRQREIAAMPQKTPEQLKEEKDARDEKIRKQMEELNEHAKKINEKLDAVSKAKLDAVEAKADVTKLNLDTSPTEYNDSNEPDFWKPLFKENEMVSLRDKIQSLFGDPTLKYPTDSIICRIITNMIPTYRVPEEINPDLINYNVTLCATMFIFGIMTKLMENQEYNIIFKGGKAVQMVLSIINPNYVYASEDIDVLLKPNTDVMYNRDRIKNLAGHLSYLIKWFLNGKTSQGISILPPNPENLKANQDIFKISYKGYGTESFKAISDIDFKEISSCDKQFFRNIQSINREDCLFRFQDLEGLIQEKVHYITQYDKKRQNKEISHEEYKFYFNKLNKSYQVLVNASK